MKFLLLLLVGVIFVHLVTANGENCLEKKSFKFPLTYLNGKLYYYAQQQKNWRDASSYCRDLDMQLVSFETSEELQAVGDWLINYNGFRYDARIWTSGSDYSEDFIWEATGQRIDMSHNWLPGQPDNNDNEEDCVAAIHRGSLVLNDVNCDHLHYNFVCEYNY